MTSPFFSAKEASKLGSAMKLITGQQKHFRGGGAVHALVVPTLQNIQRPSRGIVAIIIPLLDWCSLG